MIDEAVITRALGAALRTGGDFAEVFAEDRQVSSAVLDDGRVEELTSGRDRGAGIRVVAGASTGFASTSDLTEKGLVAAAEAAATAARSGQGGERAVHLRPLAAQHGTGVRVEPGSVRAPAKIEVLRRADAAARGAGGAIRQVTVRYGDGRRRILVANSDGLLAGDEQVRTNLSVTAVAAGDTGMQTGSESTGFTLGFEVIEDLDVEGFAARAAFRALTKLAARPAPSATMPVVLARGSGGVMFHEACGHGLEADLVRKDASVYRGRMGERVASPLVTLVDDGTFGRQGTTAVGTRPGWGSSAIDDEGHPAARNVLIDHGVLTGYMWDLVRAREQGRPPSGNGRRQSYRHLPMVRMTNTFVLNGTDDPDDIVQDTASGIYVAKLGGGQVNTATGDFVFGITEAYMISRGEIGEPVRDANLIGNGPAALAAIDVVGDDFALGGPGTCGKDGQSVPVGLGNPTLRVASLTVGGTAGG